MKSSSRMRLPIWVPLVLLTACGGETPPAAPPADAVASWHGGALGFAEVESAFAGARTPACRRARRVGGLEELVPCYRELAEGLALERLVLAEVDDVGEALAELGEDAELLRRQILLQLYLRRLRDEIEVGDAEIEARFAADRERYRRPGRLTLSNIFRRHEDPSHPEQTEAFLRRIKERFLAGETFDALAREVSQSETRLRGGLVGLLTEDALPERLRRVAFGLADGEVSDPVRVRGGAVLLYVQGVVDGADPALAEVRERIRGELTSERVEAAVAERVVGREPPPGSRVLPADELLAALDGDDPEAAALEIDGARVSAGQMRQLAGLEPAERAAGLDEEGRERLAEVYRQQLERQLLGLELVDSAAPELREEAEDRWREAAASRLTDARIRGEMERLLDGDEASLRSYFEDNRHHYQSPLRFRLRKWNLPFGADPPAQLQRLERLRARLAAGELDLPAAVAELGGEVEDLGWREFDALEGEIPDKARTYLMELGQPGFTVPYQQDDALHLIQLEAREDPRPLEYEEARERVREDYLARFQQDLYRQARDARLAAAGFSFDEAAVRRLLVPEATPTE